ncbi:MAG TPA: hypothetical protein VKQ52_10555 [Puia sp.]|nr:hypothetical protein [Puia sp.]
MRKKISSALLVGLLAFVGTRAQVSMVLQVPPTGVMQKNQLWNMAIVNAGATGSRVVIQLTLLDGKDGQAVMTAQTRPILLTSGTTMVTAREVAPVQYEYLSPQFNIDRDPNGFLPVGNYKACYSILLQAQKSEGRMAEDCIPVEVQPLSPPQLNLPADTSTVATAYPPFSWLPPTPVNLFSNLTYDFLLVEVLPDQGAYQAIQENIPTYTISHLKDPVHLYPASAKPLDTGRIYAWRILALNEGQFIAQSEVWTFKLATAKAPLVVPGGHYMPMRAVNERSAGIHVHTCDTIGIKFYSFEKDHPAVVNFYAADGTIVKTAQEHIVYGDNYLAYVLNRAFEKGKVYRIELADTRKNIYSTSFILTTAK